MQKPILLGVCLALSLLVLVACGKSSSTVPQASSETETSSTTAPPETLETIPDTTRVAPTTTARSTKPPTAASTIPTTTASKKGMALVEALIGAPAAQYIGKTYEAVSREYQLAESYWFSGPLYHFEGITGDLSFNGTYESSTDPSMAYVAKADAVCNGFISTIQDQLPHFSGQVPQEQLLAAGMTKQVDEMDDVTYFLTVKNGVSLRIECTDAGEINGNSVIILRKEE